MYVCILIGEPCIKIPFLPLAIYTRTTFTLHYLSEYYYQIRKLCIITLTQPNYSVNYKISKLPKK